MSENIKEKISIAGTPAHAVSGNSNLETGPVDMSKFNRVAFLAGVGTLGTSSNFTLYLQESNEANGANGTNISGAALAAVIATANKYATVEVRSSQLTKRYVKGVVDPGGDNASILFCVPLALEARNKPATSNDDASVVARVVV